MHGEDMIGAVQWITHITGGRRNHGPPHDITVITHGAEGMDTMTRTSANTKGSDHTRVVLDAEDAEIQIILRTRALRTAMRTVVREQDGMTVTRKLTVGHWYMVSGATDANKSITDARRTGAGQKSVIWADMAPVAGWYRSSRPVLQQMWVLRPMQDTEAAANFSAKAYKAYRDTHGMGFQ